MASPMALQEDISAKRRQTKRSGPLPAGSKTQVLTSTIQVKLPDRVPETILAAIARKILDLWGPGSQVELSGDPGDVFHTRRIIYANMVPALEPRSSDIRKYNGRFTVAMNSEDDHESLFQALHEMNVSTPFGARNMVVTKNFGQRSALRVALS